MKTVLWQRFHHAFVLSNFPDNRCGHDKRLGLSKTSWFEMISWELRCCFQPRFVLGKTKQLYYILYYACIGECLHVLKHMCVSPGASRTSSHCVCLMMLILPVFSHQVIYLVDVHRCSGQWWMSVVWVCRHTGGSSAAVMWIYSFVNKTACNSSWTVV